MLEIPHEGEITDIDRLVEETTGSSTEGFTFVSPDSIDIANRSVIFGDTRARDNVPATCQLESYVSPVPALATSDVVCLYVFSLAGLSWGLRVSLTDTVETVKTRIQEMTGVPVDQQRLMLCRSKQLEDGKLQSYIEVFHMKIES